MKIKIKGIDHIGIAVSELQGITKKWMELLGVENFSLEGVESQGVEITKLQLENGPAIELLASTGDESPISKFLKKKGEGIHHICFEVEELDKTVDTLKKRGIRFVQKIPQTGAGGARIIFIHPKEFNGVLIELKET